ncbi:hypothetical protein ACJIZ3_024001 [Penstemon smallii]|uniref:Alpha/beta hydrolase fold-3 domain-containing protein n=1 Tax=Penstemon smallii TaxID=265156 RepID=A0ABD3TT01_9LAMI
MAAKSNEIVHDFSPFLREYKDGRIERIWEQIIVPPSIDPQTNVQSKDIIISPENNISARLYLPKNPDPHNKLPLLVYFHGGAFLVESAFSQKYHKHLNLLVNEANVVALSVNYRLAPEHPLPIAYEDSWLALKWVSSESSEKEEWIRDYADLNRLYLGGDSAGGNIAHKLALLMGTELLTGIKLCGVFLNCPFFGGEVAIGDEVVHKSYIDKLWRYVSPSAIGRDEPWINPGMDPGLSSFGCKRVLVYVAEKDMLRGRVDGEEHIFSVNSPEGKSAMTFFKRLASFLNS